MIWFFFGSICFLPLFAGATNFDGTMSLLHPLFTQLGARSAYVFSSLDSIYVIGSFGPS
jgi:hypothetical protein